MLENIFTAWLKANNKRYFSFRKKNEDIDLTQNNKEKSYLLYVHIPFCEKLCPYCSFVRYEFNPRLAADYFTSLRRELKIYSDYGYNCDAVYIGGGTPTISWDELFKTIDLIKQLYPVKEISIETNPNHLTKESVGLLKQLGINRLSVGVQSFNDRILKALNRYDVHGSSDEIKERISLARDDSYTLNVDIMFNFPFQTEEMLDYDIDCIRRLKPGQVTFYPLMPSRQISGVNGKIPGKIDYKREKIFYFKILDGLSSFLRPLSVWCFGKNRDMPDEYIINRDEYMGIGSGSFGFLNGYIYANTFSLQQYINKLKKEEVPVIFSRRFSKKDRLRYAFLMQLFGTELNINRFNGKYGKNSLKIMWKELMALSMAGCIVRKNDNIALTRKGMYYWVIAMREFFISINNFREHCRALSNY